MRRVSLRITGTLWVSVLISGLPPAAAQEVGLDIQHFQPAPGGAEGFTSVMGAGVPGRVSPSFGLYTSYAYRPLSFTNSSTGDSIDVIHQMLGVDLTASVGLGSRLQLGFALPYTPFQTQDELPAGSNLPVIAPRALGDVRVMGKVALVQHEQGPSLAAALITSLPTGSEGDLRGRPGVAVEPRLALDWRFSETLRAGANLGFVWNTTPEQLTGVEVRFHVPFAGAVAYELMPDKLTVLGEVLGRVSLGMPDSQGLMVPLEANVAARWALGEHSSVTLGGGPGLTGGYGTPVFRGVASYTWTGSSVVGDRDRDAIPDDKDVCRNEAEDADGYEDADGCPELDNDKDGLEDTRDRCINTAEDPDQYQDEDGCPDLDNDKDGVFDSKDGCPNEAETVNGYDDDDGCPERDGDADGVIDARDKCVNEPEMFNNIDDLDGCPESDADQDGIIDVADKCPSRPEMKNGFEDGDGCPEKDSDSDGVADALDKCKGKLETLNGYMDDDGCPDTPPADPNRDSDTDGIPDVTDKCPTQAETRNGYKDDDGCPEKDADGDGIPDATDKCPKAAENKDGYEDDDGCPDKAPAQKEGAAPSGPDSDQDGLPDASDGCPQKAENVNGYEDEDGCPEVDTDQDGVVDALDKCKTKAENLNTFEDEDGCPDTPPPDPNLDSDGDRLPDAIDKCPRKTETWNGVTDQDGCPDVTAAEAAAEDAQPRVLVGYDSAGALSASGTATLDRLANHLKGMGDQKVRLVAYIEDGVTMFTALEASRDRVMVSQKYLISQGIDVNRIEIRIAGEKAPAATADGSMAMVRVIVLSEDSKPVPAVPSDLAEPQK